MRSRILWWFRRFLNLCATVALAALGGCAPEGALDGDPANDVAGDEIVSGRRDRGAHPAVLALALPDGGLCTGTLVAPKLVLTARHCVSAITERIDCDSSAPQVLSDYDPTRISLLAGEDARSRVVLARGARLVLPRGRRVCGADVAVLVLDRAVSEVAPMRIDAASAVSTGDRLTVVGFGARGSGPSAPYGVRYQRTVALEDWSATELVAGRSVCSGDSGGPAIDARSGAVVGVLSRGTALCTARDARSVWTRVSVAKALIDAARRSL